MSLGNNRAAILFAHVKALEALQEVKDDAAADYNERKNLAKEDGFDTNVLAAILKRRKNGKGQSMAFDDLLREYEDAVATQEGNAEEEEEDEGGAGSDETADGVPDYSEAKRIVIEGGKASTSWLQRQMRIGYNSAARLIEQLEKDGVVSAPDAQGRRTVLSLAVPGAGAGVVH
jgi:DNA segregation ATPase FtsK/SpoIIIE-like protein